MTATVTTVTNVTTATTVTTVKLVTTVTTYLHYSEPLEDWFQLARCCAHRIAQLVASVNYRVHPGPAMTTSTGGRVCVSPGGVT